MRLPLRALVPVVALALPLTLAGPASAASWTTVLDVGEARSQACKVSVQAGAAWQVRVRLANGEDGRFTARYTVSDRGDRVVDRVRLAAAPGRTTAVRTVLVRRDGSQTLGASLVGGGVSGGGLGDIDVIGSIGRC